MGLIVGTFEGWVPTPQDLYYNGVNSGGLTFSGIFEQQNTRLYAKSDHSTSWWSGNPTNIALPVKDIRSYSRLVIEGILRRYYHKDSDGNSTSSSWVSLYRRVSERNYTKITGVSWGGGYGAVLQNPVLDIAQLTDFDGYHGICFDYLAKDSYITRIRLE